MPLFFALAGSLFYLNVHGKKFEGIKELISAKSKRLLVPFALCIFLYFVPIIAIAGYWTASENPLKDIFLGQIFYLEIHIYGFCGYYL